MLSINIDVAGRCLHTTFHRIIEFYKTEIYNRKMNSFNNWQYYKFWLGTGMICKHLPTTSMLIDNISRKCIRTREKNKKIQTHRSFWTAYFEETF